MFCDKTGTLTQNELIFKAFKIVGHTNEDEVNIDDTSVKVSPQPLFNEVKNIKGLHARLSGTG